MNRRLSLIPILLGSMLALAAAAEPSGAGGSPAAPAGRPSDRPPAGIRPMSSVEGIQEYFLSSNGLRILLFPDPSKQTTTVNITYLVGSRNESYGETGMAHLLEHLLFKGSKGHLNIPDELTSHGCRPNGSTWFDRTNYFETFAASEQNLEWALDLEADRMVNSFIAQKDLDSEMTVVRNEFEVDENDPGGVLEERVASTAFLWHNYGKSTIGARSDIERVPIERLQAFYRTWYQPDNALLVVAGNFDRDRVLALIDRKFGSIPRPERALPATYTEEPPQDGEREVELRRVGEAPMVKVAYHIPAGSHPDFAAVEILGLILGQEPSGRLYKSLVESHLASRVGVSSWQFRDPGLIVFTANLRKEGSLEKVRAGLIQGIEDLAASPPSTEEVERARQSLLKDWELTMRESQRAAIGLSEWAAMGDWRLLFLHRDQLRKVTVEDVQRVAGTYLAANNRTLGLFIPTEKPERVVVPPAPDIAALVGGYTGGEALASGEEFDTSPQNIEATVVRSALPAGLKLILLPKKTHGRTVSISLSLHMGDEASLKNQAYIARLTSEMLLRGTQKHSRQEIQDALDAIKARLRLGGGGGFRGALASSPDNLRGSGECAAEDLPDLLRVMAEVLRAPSFPANEFALAKEEQLRGLEERKDDPRAMAGIALQRHLNPWPKGDVRYNPTPDEELAGLQSVTLDQVQAFYREFYGASAGELAIVGDFDPKQIEPLVRDLFSDWKSARPYQRLVSVYREIPALTERIETPDKESACMSAGLRLNLRDDDPSYPALVLANFMTGGGFLNSRLAVRIRQKEGFSYGIGSFLSASAFDKNGAFGAFAIYAPQNREELDAAFREEIARVVDAGFTAEEVSAARSGWLQQRTVSRSSDRELAGMLTSRAFEGRDLSWDGGLEAKVAALTPEQIQQAVREYVDPGRISIVHAGDFAKAAGAEKVQTAPGKSGS